jgi:hypothetical protein
LGDVLRRAEVARLSPAVRMAHRLLAFSAARIGNAVEARVRVIRHVHQTKETTVANAAGTPHTGHKRTPQ